MWKSSLAEPIGGGTPDDNVVEVAELATGQFQLNLKQGEGISPFQAYSAAVALIIAVG